MPISHAGHDHPSTPAGRKACRNSNGVAKTPSSDSSNRTQPGVGTVSTAARKKAKSPRLSPDLKVLSLKLGEGKRIGGVMTCSRKHRPQGYYLDMARDFWVCDICHCPTAEWITGYLGREIAEEDD